MLEAIAARQHESELVQLDVIDVIFNGELPLLGFELPGGPIGAAIGFQRRDDSFMTSPSPVQIAGNAWIGSPDPIPVSHFNRVVDSFFLELAIPLLSNLELELAVRNEDFDSGQKSTDPKFGITYAPTDWLTLRATQGDAFIAPTLEQLFEPVNCGLLTVTDRFGPFDAFTLGCGGGNSALQNETAKSKQLGFDLNFNDFDFHFTWNETAFENRIIRTSAQTIINLDFFAFQQWSGFSGDGLTPAAQPSLAQVQSWVDSGLSDPRIHRDSTDVLTIGQMDSGRSNAQSVKVTAYDIEANYQLSLNDWGDVRVGFTATYIDEFLYQDDPSSPVIDGAGLYNNGTAAAPNLPQIKANLRVGWVRGDHAVTSTLHYIDSLPYDGPSGSSIPEFAFTNYSRDVIDNGIKAWTDMDIAYTYRGYEAFGGEASFTLGLRNAFDRQAQRSPEFAGVIGELQDPIGRVIYARMVYDF